jgi:hypothetical protein
MHPWKSTVALIQAMCMRALQLDGAGRFNEQYQGTASSTLPGPSQAFFGRVFRVLGFWPQGERVRALFPPPAHTRGCPAPTTTPHMHKACEHASCPHSPLLWWGGVWGGAWPALRARALPTMFARTPSLGRQTLGACTHRTWLVCKYGGYPHRPLPLLQMDAESLAELERWCEVLYVRATDHAQVSVVGGGMITGCRWLTHATAARRFAEPPTIGCRQRWKPSISHPNPRQLWLFFPCLL